MNKIIIIAGPTASGKSSLAVKIAKKLDTEIISCDSMQIYKYMNIGTAKVTTEEMNGVKHHMIDIVEPNENFSVGGFREKAIRIIDDLHKQNKIPIVVGGTGLYIDSLIYQYSFFSNSNLAVREKLNEELAAHDALYMHEKLKAIDPEEAAKIHPNNTKRVLRALEIYETCGKTKSLNNERILNTKYDFCLVVINKNRDILYDNINKRVDKMFNDGLLDEIKFLINNNLVNWDSQSMQAIGYKEFKQYFDNAADLEKVKYDIKINSRHYAKRQISWFNRYEFAKFENDNNIIESYIDNFIK